MPKFHNENSIQPCVFGAGLDASLDFSRIYIVKHYSFQTYGALDKNS
jgi:hypothetical protein